MENNNNLIDYNSDIDYISSPSSANSEMNLIDVSLNLNNSIPEYISYNLDQNNIKKKFINKNSNPFENLNSKKKPLIFKPFISFSSLEITVKSLNEILSKSKNV